MNEDPVKKDLAGAKRHLRRGEVIGVPTDTVYGLAADPGQARATTALFDLKGRPVTKAIGLLAADVKSARRLVDLPAYAIVWTDQHWPGPLNLVASARFPLPDGLGDPQRGTLAIRVPDHPLARALLAEYGPLAVTSANRSDGPETLDDQQARAVFGEGVGLYLPGRCPGAVASTTVDVTGPVPRLLRKGPLDLGL